MNYYFLKVKVDEITGNPQILTTDPKYDLKDLKGVYAFSQMSAPEFPDVDEIRYLILEKSSKLEDVLNAEMLQFNGLLVNQKVRSVLSRANLPTHKYYNAYVKDPKHEIHNYFWLQTGRDREKSDYLDYEGSEFYIQKDLIGVNRETIEINSKEDLEREMKKLNSLLGQGVKMSKASLNSSFLEFNLDLFQVGRLTSDWIITENLRKLLLEAEISGISIKPANNLEVAD